MDFDMACAQLLIALRTGRPLSQVAKGCLTTGLGRLVGSFYPVLSREDRADIASTALLNLIVAFHEGHIDLTRNPAPYLITTARNASIDHLRRTAREQPVADPDALRGDVGIAAVRAAATDDPFDDLFTALDDQTLLRYVMAAARDAGDHAFNTTARVWLSLSQQERRKVSLREVGQQMGLSHTEVRNRLQRCWLYMPSNLDPEFPPSSPST